MVKISGLMVLKHGLEGSDPVILAKAKDLCGYGVSRRARLMDLASRTLAKQTLPGQRQCIRHQEYLVYSYNKDDLSAVAFTDEDYPARSALLLLNKTIDDYQEKFGDSWKMVKSDIAQEWPCLTEALIKYQDPAEIDKLLKLQRQLDETKAILVTTIDRFLERGAQLDRMVKKTSELCAASKMFHKRARKSSCCFPILRILRA